MKIAFRADASISIGSGHVMRCLTLADALHERGAEIMFICREHEGNLCDMIESRGHSVERLPAPETPVRHEGKSYASWLGSDWEIDASQTIHALTEKVDWLVVDHYAIDFRWESKLREVADKIVAIDDLADRKHDCDVLLDQNYYLDIENRYVGKVPGHCQLLLGPKYALLREEFYRMHKQVGVRNGTVKRIFVFFGGMDACNCTGHAIEALGGVTVNDLHVDVVIGSQHPFREQIESECARNGFVCHVQTDKMAELMAAADLSIGAGGSATWERCCMGLPSIVFAVSQHQEKSAKDLSVLGAVKFIGTAQDVTVQKLRNVFEQGCDAEWIREASLCGLELVDGDGVRRVNSAMEAI